MSGSCREALPDFRELSVDSPGCLKVVGRPSRLPGSGREGIPYVPKWSGGPPGCP